MMQPVVMPMGVPLQPVRSSSSEWSTSQAPIPASPMPAGRIPMAYTPFRFTPPIPAPLPPVMEPMPDVQRQYEYAEKKDQMRQKDIERKEKKRVGLFGSFVGALEAGAALVEKGIHEASNQIDTSIRSQTYESSRKNFLEYFRLDPNQERLWREYGCRCVNGASYVVGNLYISDHYLCFMGETKLPAPDNGITRLAFMVPLINILCWHRANILKSNLNANAAVAPGIQLNTNLNFMQLPPEQRPDALMVYTNDGSVHSYYAFWHYDHACNVLDHAWRAAFVNPTPAPVPLPESQILPALKPLPATGSNQPHPAPTFQSYPPPNNPNAVPVVAPQPAPQPAPAYSPQVAHQPMMAPAPQVQPQPSPNPGSVPSGYQQQPATAPGAVPTGYPPGYSPQMQPAQLQPIPQSQSPPPSGYPPGYSAPSSAGAPPPTGH